MANPDPNYDILAAIDLLMPGIVVQRELVDAARDRYAAKNYAALDASDVSGILTAAGYPAALPNFPTSLGRIADSNPVASDGWVQYGPDQTGFAS